VHAITATIYDIRSCLVVFLDRRVAKLLSVLMELLFTKRKLADL